MRILIVGAGAVGGYFGARWSDGGRDVTLLVRGGRRQERLASDGLVLVRNGEEHRTHPRVVVAADLSESFDVIFLSVPGSALCDAVEELKPAVGPRTVIVSSLNGVRHFERLRDTFGNRAVPGSVVKCVTSLDDDGRIIELAPLAQISIGAWDGADPRPLEPIRALLAVDGIDVKVSDMIEAEVSEKWLMMAALGAANSLLGGDVAAINADHYGGWAIQEMLMEGQRALDEIGMPARTTAVDAMSVTLGDPTSHQTTSLYRNMLAGRPIEAEPIVGDLLARVADHRFYPLLSAAYARLAIYEAARLARSAALR